MILSDKKTYWKNRNDNKRGQGELLINRFWEKGSGDVNDVNFSTKEIINFKNDKGSHNVRTKSGFVAVNRKNSRRKTKLRAYTKPGFQSLRKPIKAPHEYRPEKDPTNEAFVHSSPKYPAQLSNHIRHRERQIAREAVVIQKRKEREALKNGETKSTVGN